MVDTHSEPFDLWTHLWALLAHNLQGHIPIGTTLFPTHGNIGPSTLPSRSLHTRHDNETYIPTQPIARGPDLEHNRGAHSIKAIVFFSSLVA